MRRDIDTRKDRRHDENAGYVKLMNVAMFALLLRLKLSGYVAVGRAQLRRTKDTTE